VQSKNVQIENHEKVDGRNSSFATNFRIEFVGYLLIFVLEALNCFEALAIYCAVFFFSC
jgi:hypothetical protein